MNFPLFRRTAWLWTLLAAGFILIAPAILRAQDPAAGPPPVSSPIPRAMGDFSGIVEAVVPMDDRHYGTVSEALIHGARESIRICLYQARFYLKYPGSQSNRLVDNLILARRRGVRVEAIIDTSPWKEEGRFDEENFRVAERLAREGCRVYLDSPLIQSHQKIMIVDGHITVVSSANWSHFSLSSNREVAAALWSEGLGRAYEEYFCARIGEATPFEVPSSPSLSLQATPAPPPASSPRPEDFAALGRPVFTGVHALTLNNRDYYPRLHKALREAAHSIDLIQDYAYYYFAPPISDIPPAPDAVPRVAASETNLLFDDMVTAHRRGLRVRAAFDLTQFEDGSVTYNAEDFANRLGALGVPVYQDEPAVRIHAKMLLIDDERIVIGSTNLSVQALEMNNECSLLLTSKELGAYYREWVNSILARSTPLLPTPPQ